MNQKTTFEAETLHVAKALQRSAPPSSDIERAEAGRDAIEQEIVSIRQRIARLTIECDAATDELEASLIDLCNANQRLQTIRKDSA